MMVTAYRDDERRRRAGELGAFEFITKPVPPERPQGGRPGGDRLKAQLHQLPAAVD